jgi:hypothetical protein
MTVTIKGNLSGILATAVTELTVALYCGLTGVMVAEPLLHNPAAVDVVYPEAGG